MIKHASLDSEYDRLGELTEAIEREMSAIEVELHATREKTRKPKRRRRRETQSAE